MGIMMDGGCYIRKYGSRKEKNVRIITQFQHDPETMQPGEKVPKLARPNIKPDLYYYIHCNYSVFK